MATEAIENQIGALDPEVFSFIEAQTNEWDRRALLALHTAVAEACGDFAYLEIGSYRGGSLQALMRDPRCRRVMSIDPRPATTPDARTGQWEYEENTTERMLHMLSELPGVDMGKLLTFEATTETLTPSALPARPDLCFIDGEHTPGAVMRDAQFCSEAVGGAGVIAFHDYFVVGSGVSAFVRAHWPEISFAVAFNLPSYPAGGSGVLALEIGGRGLLRHPVIERAVASRWHSTAWKLASRPRRASLPFRLTCATMPAIDSFIAIARHGFSEYLAPRG